MYIVVGLGNPGKEYENTRHNVGFTVVDQLATTDFDKDQLGSLTSRLKIGKENILLVKPQTFMNRSGEVVNKIISRFKIQDSRSDNLWVIYDDLDLSLGTIRIKFDGSSAGHNGVQSIINALRSDQFWRFRIGIGRPSQQPISNRQQSTANNLPAGKAGQQSTISDPTDYVLSPFDKDELLLVKHIIDQTAQKILQNLQKGSIVGETIKIK
jgi:PTH1 family peptidyl-tRNA hydrolase